MEKVGRYKAKNLVINAWLFRDTYVVVRKRQIKNATDDEFKPVRLVLPEDFIVEMYEMINSESETEE